MALDEYRRKRKFDKTPEPKGGKLSRDPGPLRFVVQMHRATRLHFDFRLELDGVLKSWAVPRGPSLSPLDQRLAVYVEDHPIEYGDFEGIIPPGNYGAGTVVVWDRGTYLERTSHDRAESEAKLREGLQEGHITFLLSGEKLRGEFALVRLKKSREPNAWLLLKKRDEFAVDRPDRQPGNESVKSGRTLEQIAAQARARGEVWLPKKGLIEGAAADAAASSDWVKLGRAKAGAAGGAKAAGGVKAAASSVKAPARKKAAPATTAAPATAKRPERATLLRRVKPMIPATGRKGDEAPEGWLVHAQPPGVRAIAEVEANGPARLHSKNLLGLEREHPALVSALRGLKRGLVLDGFVDGERFAAIDLLYVDGHDLRALALGERLARLKKLPIFHGPIELGLSGKNGPLLARNPESRYVSGVSSDWRMLPFDAAGIKKYGTTAEGPAFTHLEKILWPDDGYAKRDLIEYYKAVAPALVPHLRDRPESMNRHPDGIARPGFFQKDLSGYYPRWIQTTRLYTNHSKRTINFLLCNDERTLLYMANLGCIELNPWLSRVPNLDQPDFCVIDLDPADGMKFSVVTKVALAVKDVLDEAEAPAFCKTSGSSGIHIYVPTDGKVDYDSSRAFAIAVCDRVQQRLPDLTTLERSPAKRRGRLYLDCFQNARGQTLASVYCVRPRPGATVSAPLRWSEVGPRLDPCKFTIKTLPKRLEKTGELWADLLTTRADLPRCLGRLEKSR
jgi:bifunctional non-homologous end joining protein LigD